MARWTPKPDSIYLGDNGRAYCGEHLGMTARTTGRDLSGQRLYEVTPEDVAELLSVGDWPTGQLPELPRCEACSKEARRIHVAG